MDSSTFKYTCLAEKPRLKSEVSRATARGKMKIKWFYQVMSEVYGPVETSALKRLALNNDINRDTFVRREDGEWVTADRIRGLFRTSPTNRLDNVR